MEKEKQENPQVDTELLENKIVEESKAILQEQDKEESELSAAFDQKMEQFKIYIEQENIDIQEAFYDKLDELKEDVLDQVHKENVKCYRNIQFLLEEFNRKLEEAKEREADEREFEYGKNFRMIKIFLIFLIGFVSVNFFVLLLNVLGIL